MKFISGNFRGTLYSCAGMLLALGTSYGQLVISDTVRSFSTLTNTTVTMDGKSELHITGTSNPIAGSTIHLNSEDSWLWLDNLRPTTADNYLGQIRVNGAAAVHGSNVRVVQFGMGTVITPFTNSIQPLETFTDSGFKGTSRRYGLYTYYNTSTSLGAMHRNITSFKLKRGFMATFATEANGRGVSKVYIAQDHDLNVGNLPSGLDNAVQYVRVLPWRWVSKKGSCDVAPEKLNAAWHYNWANDKNSALDWEYVPIRQQRWWPEYPNNKTSITHVLGFNEPDNPVEDSYQTLGNGSVDAAIAAWPEFMESGLRIGAPAVTDGGKAWLWSFMDKANAAGLRVDYIPIHFYRCGHSTAQFKAFLQEIWDRYQKPVWVTEFNNGANWTTCGDPTYNQNASVIGGWIDMLDSTPWVERYAVYSNVEGVRNMVYQDGSLTPAGVVYRDQKSPIGYLQEYYTPSVKRGMARLPLDGHTRDIGGYDNGGISYGAPVYTAGHRGQALQFDGSNFHVKLPPAVANSGSFTFAAWVNWQGGTANQRIFDFGNGTEQYFFLSPSIGGEMRLGLRNNSSSTKYIATDALPTGSWQHVAVTIQGTTARIYLNGVQQVQGTLSDAALSATMNNYLGKSQWSTDPQFSGSLDDVTIVDSAMAADEIVHLMNDTLPPFSAHWTGDKDGAWETNIAGDTNWSIDALGTTDPGQVPGSNTDVNFTGGLNLASTVLGADFSVRGLTFSAPSGTGIGGSHGLSIGAGGVNVASGTGTTTIHPGGGVAISAEQTWINNSANGLVIDSALSGSATLNVAGSGKTVFTGNNTYSGSLYILSGGTVSVASLPGTLGSAAQIRMGGGGTTGTLLYTGPGETSDRVLTLNGGFGTPGAIIDQSGEGLLKLTANFAVNASVAKTVTLQGSTSGTGEISGVISNGGSTTSLAKKGSGTWTLSGANTYTGATTLSQGTLVIAGNSALGTGTLDLAGGTIQSADATARTLANAITLSASSTFGGTGDLVFTGAVNAGNLPKTFTVNNTRTQFNGAIGGGAARVKAGPGTLVFGGNNTYTGATTISSGTLVVNGSLTAASAVSVANGATLSGTGTVNGTSSFSSGSRYGWSLTGDSAVAGKLTMGPVFVTSGAKVDLDFNKPGSTVDFSSSFWTQSHNWQLLSSSSMTGTFSLGVVSPDSLGNAVSGHGNFYIQQNSTGIKLYYAPAGAEPPPAPTGLSASVSPGLVSLTWDATPGATGYNVLRSTHPEGPYQLAGSDVGGTSFGDKSVADGTTYYYVIVAVSPNGESNLSAEITATPHLPSVIDKAENSSDLGQAGSWATAIVPGAFDTARWAGLAGANAVYLGTNLTWSGIVIANTGGSVSIGEGNVLTLGSGGIDLSASNQDLSISSGLSLASGPQVWKVPSGRGLSLATGNFSRVAGSTLNIQGTGPVLSSMPSLANEGSTGILGPWATVGTGAATTYATHSGGAITSYTTGTGASAASLPNPGTTNDNYNLTIASTTTYGAASRNSNTIRNTVGATTLTFGNSSTQINLVTNGVMNSGTGLLSITHGGSHAGSGIQIGPNSGRELVLNAVSGSLSLGRIINNGGGASSVTVNSAGINTVTLASANTFTGGVQLGSGTLLAGNAASLGTGQLGMKGGYFGSTAAMTIPNVINVTGTNYFGHPAQTTDLTLSGELKGSGILKNVVGTSGASNLIFSGNLSGFSGTIDFTGRAGNDTQRWRVGANNTTVDLSNASLILRIGNVTDTSVLSRTFGFKDAVTNSTLRLGSLSGDGVFQASYNNSGPNLLQAGYLNSNTTFSGMIGGAAGTSLSFSKVGTGTMTLSGSNPYTGATTVDAGTLMLNGSLTGHGAVSVNSGARLAGTGSSSGAVTVRGGGILAPGSGNGGVLNLPGGLALEEGAVLEVGLGASSARVASGGTFSASGITIVNLTSLAGFGPGIYPLVTGATGIDAASFALGTTPVGFVCELSANGGTLSVTVAAPPQVPVDLVATGGSSGIVLSWTGASSAAGYNVKRSTESGNVYETIASGVTGTSYSDMGLSVGDTYYYVVSAVNSLGESEDSVEASARVLSFSELWRLEHFGVTGDEDEAADGADPDNDGLSNLIEYALGSLPKGSAANAGPRAEIIGGKLVIHLTRNPEAIDVVMTVLATGNLATGEWVPIARSAGGSAFTNVINELSTGAVIQETIQGDIRSVQVTDVHEVGDPEHPKRFLKLHVDR